MDRILHSLFSFLGRNSPLSLTNQSFPCLREESIIANRYKNLALADMWKDIQGSKWWDELLDPINPVLKAEILRYGDFSELCYDAFDCFSELCYDAFDCEHGGCKYSRDKLFQCCPNGYEVTKYLYADTDILGRETAVPVWIGFIAVCIDDKEIQRLGRRDIVIAWRGTQTLQEWIEDVRDISVPDRLAIKHKGVRAGFSTTAHFIENGVRVEEGFLSCYISHGENSKSARDIVISEILRLVDEYKEGSLSVTLTGHSLGAALATLSSYDVKKNLDANFPGQRIPVTVFAFASPRVGNRAFAMRMAQVGVKVLRLVNKDDIVPKVPGLVFNENCWTWLIKLLDWLPRTYFHVGVQIILHNHDLINKFNLVYDHSLKVYLQLIDGYVGNGKQQIDKRRHGEELLIMAEAG